MKMLCFLSKIERKILSDITKAKPRDERGRFVKRHKLPKNNTRTHTKITFDKVFISLLLVAGLAFCLAFARLHAEKRHNVLKTRRLGKMPCGD